MAAAPTTAQQPPVAQQPTMAPQQGYVNTSYTQYNQYQNTVAPGPYMPVPPAGPPGFVPNTEYYVGRYGHKGKTMQVENATYTGVRIDCQEDFCKDCSKKVSLTVTVRSGIFSINSIQTVVQVDMAAKRKCMLMCIFILCLPIAICLNLCIQACIKKHEKPRRWFYDGAKKTCQRCKSVKTVTKDEMDDFVENHKMVHVKHKRTY